MTRRPSTAAAEVAGSPPLSVAEAAERLGVCERTLRRWVTDGRVDAAQPAGPGGRVLVSRASIEALLAGGALDSGSTTGGGLGG